MSATDAGFYYGESENTPLHVGSVSVFEGPAPSYGDLVRLLLSKLSQVPRYRQRVRPVPLHLGRPVWVDDPHFQILYHVRHTAVPSPGGDEELRNLAGRVLGQRLDLAKPLWEVWLIEGLADGRWALISKVHHCMVDGIAGADLMQLIFDVDPAAQHPEPSDWRPGRDPSAAGLVAGAVADTMTAPLREVASRASKEGLARGARSLLGSGRSLATALPQVMRQASTPVARTLTGPIGPHRRWAWTDAGIEEFKSVRRAFGGTVNDVVLTAITRGFRDLLDSRAALAEDVVVRSMVPVSVRRPGERGQLDNRVSAVFVDLPVGEADPVERLARVRTQMDDHKRTLQAIDVPSIIAMSNFVAPTLLALGVRAGMQTGPLWCQAVTTNVPGPRVPLYVLGRRMVSLHAYVPIGGGPRVSIGIFSYLDAMTFGVNADFDGFPDVDVLTAGIRRGIDELVELASRAPTAATS